jgi:hypothetical protein
MLLAGTDIFKRPIETKSAMEDKLSLLDDRVPSKTAERMRTTSQVQTNAHYIQLTLSIARRVLQRGHVTEKVISKLLAHAEAGSWNKEVPEALTIL